MVNFFAKDFRFTHKCAYGFKDTLTALYTTGSRGTGESDNKPTNSCHILSRDLCLMFIVVLSLFFNLCIFEFKIYVFNLLFLYLFIYFWIYVLIIWLFRIQYKTLIVEACNFSPNSTLQEIARCTK